MRSLAILLLTGILRAAAILQFAVLISAFIVTPAAAVTVTKYEVGQDEFSNNQIPRLMLGTNNSETGILVISCYPSGLQAQILVETVIFPDNADVEGGSMWVKITHKVDSAPQAASNKWRMDLGKYKSAWLMKNISPLIDEMQKGERLSLRLDKNGTIYRFDLKESHEHLPKVLVACRNPKKK